MDDSYYRGAEYGALRRLALCASMAGAAAAGNDYARARLPDEWRGAQHAIDRAVRRAIRLWVEGS